MSDVRPSIFNDDTAAEDVDLSRFAPKAPKPAPAPPEAMRRLATENGFPSRAPAPSTDNRLSAVSQQSTAVARPDRRGPKSGRTVLLNARVTPRAHERFHAIVAEEHARYEAGQILHKPTLGEIVERALAALERERKEGGERS